MQWNLKFLPKTDLPTFHKCGKIFKNLFEIQWFMQVSTLHIGQKIQILTRIITSGSKSVRNITKRDQIEKFVLSKKLSWYQISDELEKFYTIFWYLKWLNWSYSDLRSTVWNDGCSGSLEALEICFRQNLWSTLQQTFSNRLKVLYMSSSFGLCTKN